jgi:outer membrane protein OmpA-like peptidoglycan-associated protein
VREGDNINLILPGNITFASGGYQLNTNFLQVLDSVVLVVNEYKKTITVVAGHTDSQGSNQADQTLSERRAASVSFYLISKKVANARTESTGFGENFPIGNNAIDEGRSQNQRVELSLVPITEGS